MTTKENAPTLYQPRVDGKPFRCEARVSTQEARCNSSVFRKHGEDIFECNACGQLYEAE